MGNVHPQENLYIGHSLAERDTLRYVLNPIDREVSGQNMKHQEFLVVLICDLLTEKSYFSESAVFGTDRMMLLLKEDRKDQARW